MYGLLCMVLPLGTTVLRVTDNLVLLYCCDSRDLQYMSDLLQQIDSSNIPAPAPIEQRWTSSSSAPMSPASHTHATTAAAGGTTSSSSSSSKKGCDIAPDSVHSWVGIIMYLPTEEESVRKAITDRWVVEVQGRGSMLGYSAASKP